VEATDEDVLVIIKRQVKQRRDSIDQFEKGGRPELAESEKAELAVLEKYMPEMMSEDQVRAIVEEVVTAVGASGPSDMGKVMGAVMGKVNGQADGGLVKQMVQAVLSN
ncbi:MAG: GatB/YqeY domain-containing protein, partial [Candidatus Peregrinibacteria bacterium]|nr:GatB/YqeY domain-containing protein [Candidatus Peregrinibacteria bacterium]